MARRNLFQPPPPPEAPATPDTAEATARRGFPNTGAMSGMKSTLRDLSANAVREIDPQLIEEYGPRDRLAFSDADVAALADSIRQHGQQVPLLVRPSPEAPGRFRVVYGRRRLRALRLLGIPAKALVRSLDDAQAVLAQGQENSQRLDPSFLEKALFAAELARTGYEPQVIQDALAVDKPMLSRMAKVARSIPQEVADLIGPAHGIGRRRWEELADLAQAEGLDLTALAQSLSQAFDGLSSDQRFMALLEAAQKRPAPDDSAAQAGPDVIRHADGTKLAEIRTTSKALVLKLTEADAPGFAGWLRENAGPELVRMYDNWKAKSVQD